MPTKAKPTSQGPRARVRRIRAVAASFKSVKILPDGSQALVGTDANRGDEVRLSPTEEMRLDSLGVLAPPGSSREQVEHEVENMVEAYRAARRELPGSL